VTFARKSGGGNVTPTTVKRRSVAAWVDVQTIKRRSGGSWVTVWSAYTALSMSPLGSLYGTGRSGKPVYDEQLNATAATSGGRAPLTFSWTFVSGSSVIKCATTTTASTTFKCSSGPIAGPFTETATWRCTVSDGISSASQNISVTFEFL
jgi:hypothetical protein